MYLQERGVPRLLALEGVPSRCASQGQEGTVGFATRLHSQFLSTAFVRDRVLVWGGGGLARPLTLRCVPASWSLQGPGDPEAFAACFPEASFLGVLPGIRERGRLRRSLRPGGAPTGGSSSVPLFTPRLQRQFPRQLSRSFAVAGCVSPGTSQSWGRG